MMIKLLNIDVKVLTTSILFLLSTAVSAEQTCDGSTETTLVEDFEISEDEPNILTHTSTGLSWARCAVGQTWNNDDSTCEGTATSFNWQEALALSTSYGLEDKTDWRLPNIKELASIVERNCVDPSARLSLFPDTPSGSFWSASTNTASNRVDYAWAVTFTNGSLDSHAKQQDFYVRMVRYAE